MRNIDNLFIEKWAKYDGKKWTYVVQEGLLKQGLLFAAIIYVLNIYVFKVVPAGPKPLLVTLLLMPIFEIPLALMLYASSQKRYAQLTAQKED